MSLPHFTKELQNKPDILDKQTQLEPVYIPDWMAVEQEAQLMLDYWQHIAEIARIEQILENIDGGRL